MVPTDERKELESREKPEVTIKSVDMFEDLQNEIIDLAHEAMMRYTIEKDVAMHIKRTLDERKGQTWHVIVGRNFGSFVTHETKHFIYFYLTYDESLVLPGLETPPVRRAILVFKTQ